MQGRQRRVFLSLLIASDILHLLLSSYLSSHHFKLLFMDAVGKRCCCFLLSNKLMEVTLEIILGTFPLYICRYLLYNMLCFVSSFINSLLNDIFWPEYVMYN